MTRTGGKHPVKPIPLEVGLTERGRELLKELEASHAKQLELLRRHAKAAMTAFEQDRAAVDRAAARVEKGTVSHAEIHLYGDLLRHTTIEAWIAFLSMVQGQALETTTFHEALLIHLVYGKDRPVGKARMT